MDIITGKDNGATDLAAHSMLFGARKDYRLAHWKGRASQITSAEKSRWLVCRVVAHGHHQFWSQEDPVIGDLATVDGKAELATF